MKGKKLLSALIAGAMVLGTMSFPVFAEEVPEPDFELQAAEDISEEISLMSVDDSWIDNANTDWYNDTDTEFTLTTAEQLAGLAQIVINGNNFSGKTIKLGNDIDLAGKNWTPIGGDTKSFNGTFDGGEFSVNNMTAKNSYSYGNGFFHSLIGPAAVKNVSFNKAKVYNPSYYSGNVYGIVSGYAYGNVTFENIHVDDSWVRGYGKVGSILGMAADWGGTTVIKDCKVDNVDVYGIYNCATFIGTSLNSVDMAGCSYSDVPWVPYWAETYYPVETTVVDSGEIVNGLFWKYSVWYYAAWSDLYNIYRGDDKWDDVSGLTWTDDSSADGFCVNDYASIGNTQYSSLQDAIDAAEEGDKVTLRRNYKNATVNADKNITFDTAQYIMPNVVTPDSKYIKKINKNTYSILDSESTVIDNAKTTGAEVTLDNLKNNASIDHEPDSTYKVVVSTAPKADAEKANAKIEADGDTNTDKAIFDISIEKTDSTGVTTDISKQITGQKVTLTLGETPVGDVKVYHVNGDVVEPVTPVTVIGNTVTFIAPGFSTYAVTYTAAALTADEITKKIGVAFERVGKTQTYDIVLKAMDGKKINRFMSTDLTFDLNVQSGAVGYTIEPEANVNLIEKDNGRYEFNLDGLNSNGATGSEITIGKVTFEGSGTIEFKVADADTNIVNTAKAADNIVDNYTTSGDAVTTGKLVLNDNTINGVINETFKAATKNLTINVAFNNAVENNLLAYQSMLVSISGGDLDDNEEFKLGSNNSDVTFDAATNTYTIVVADKLTQNTAYNVTVSGEGYRTARYTVTMTEDKTLNFWNNVKDNAIEMITGDGKDVTKNFLAGEIVKDNQINIYDLSAVVSYFGKTGLKTASDYGKFVRYDLNRDGKIDSKDVAYVLVSWGE